MRLHDKVNSVYHRVRIYSSIFLVCGLFTLAFGYEWNIELIDRAGSGYNSIDIDSLGRPHIAYRNAASDLRYAYKDSTNWRIQNVAESCGRWLSLKLSQTGKPKISHISYTYASPTGKLLYSYIQNDTWRHIIVDTLQTCKYSSLALDSMANPCISYLSGEWLPDDTLKVKYAHLNDSIWDFQLVDSCPIYVGGSFEFKSTSIALDNAGKPHIAYGYDGVDYVSEYGFAGARYAFFDSSWNVENIRFSSRYETYYDFNKMCLKFDQTRKPNVAYSFTYSYLSSLEYKFKDPDSGWQRMGLSDTLARNPSLDIDSLNRTHIAYFSENRLMYAIWDGISWTYDTITTGNFSGEVSLKLDQNDNPHICFFLSDGLYYAYGSPVGIKESENNRLTIPDLKISPSPASKLMKITLALPAPEKIELQLYDVSGSLVKNIFSGYKGKGTADFFWDGRDNRGHKVPQGIYFCRLKTKDYCIPKKIVINR